VLKRAKKRYALGVGTTSARKAIWYDAHDAIWNLHELHNLKYLSGTHIPSLSNPELPL
jgi:hypothetical protein